MNMSGERRQGNHKADIVRDGKVSIDQLLADLADITAQCIQLQRALDDYEELLMQGCVPAVVYDKAIGIGDRLQVRGLQFASEMLTAMAMPKDTIAQDPAAYVLLGKIEGRVEGDKLVLKMPLPVKAHALAFRGAAALCIPELDTVLAGLDLRSFREKDGYTVSFTFHVPDGGAGARDHDNYYIKPVIDTICLHLHTTDSPHYIKLVLESVFDTDQEPCMIVSVAAKNDT